jgi:Ca-activated chloride channel family protein
VVTICPNPGSYARLGIRRANGRGQEPFYAVYPKDALAISDAPLGFRPHNNQFDADKRRIVTELQDYLLNDPDAQAELLRLGRPAAKSFGLTLTGADPAVFNADWGLQPVVTGQEVRPPAAAVIGAALDKYQTAFRRPAQTWFCLDGSGSMGGNQGWDGIRAAGHQLFDVEQARAHFLLTHPEDRTTVAIFRESIQATRQQMLSPHPPTPGQHHPARGVSG